MKLRFLTLLLLSSPLYAQLELPEYLFLDEIPNDEAVRVDERHKGDAPEKGKEDPKGEAQREMQSIMGLNMMNNGQVVFRGGAMPGAEKKLPENRRQIERLTGGTAALAAELNLVKGGPVKGLLANQVIRIEASFGILPLRLSQLQRMLRQENGTYLFETRDGDLFQGKPLHKHLTLSLPDGGKRVVPLLDLTTLELTPVADEPVSP